MANHKELVEKVKKYVEQLKREEKIRHALSRLERIDMSLKLLEETKVGKAVNRLRDHELYGDDAHRIVTNWKEIAKRNGIVPKAEPVDDSEYEPYEPECSTSHSSRERERDRDYEQRKRRRSETPPMKAVKHEIVETKPRPKVIKCEPTMFEQMLSEGDKVTTSKPRKLKPSTDWNMIKPEIDINYRPLPTAALHVTSKKEPEKKESEFQQFKPRNDKLKVFAGRRKIATCTTVPTLFDACIRVIGNNIDAIESTGDIPFSILKPVLEKCTSTQLTYIEARNPYLEDDTDDLWEKLVARQFPGSESDHHETWKEAFQRLVYDKEERLRMLSQKIGASHKAAEEKGQRKAMLADATAPRDVRRRQIAHGTGHTTHVLPSALEVSNARRKIFDNAGSKSSLAVLPRAVVNNTSQVGAKRTNRAGGPVPIALPAKKGHLMAKTRKMLSMKRR